MGMSHAHAISPEPFAPWAEIVPDAPRATAESLLARQDDGWQYEVVEGVLVRMAGSGLRASTIARRLAGRLGDFVDDRGLGQVTGADGVYKFSGAETGLVPDVGFFAAARQSLIRDPNKPIPFAPDLAVEVASPSQDRVAMAAKTALYFAGGTRLVWIIWPDDLQVDVWRRGTIAPVTLRVGDTLDGENVATGFTYPVARLFT
jgi:Uma2 family endonuclease